MIPEFGLFALIMALLLSMTTVILPILTRSSISEASQIKINASVVLGQACFILLSFVTLVFCFVQDDFSVRYVAQNANTYLPFMYKLTAIWGAHEGSLLLWSFILALWMVAVLFVAKAIPGKVKMTVLTILSCIQTGLLMIILKTSNPFIRILPFFPQDGADLNPLLQDPAFIMHPPFLYLGYVGFAVPFAFALAECLLKKMDYPWASWARPFALSALGFLTIGITLGSWWAYYELGWGGWWFWDPVENASLMPWIVGVALIHMLWVSAKEDLFRTWRLSLAIFTFILSLMGTFLVRSGILSSVHAFSSSPERGIAILGFLSIVVVISLGLLSHLRGEQKQAFVLSPWSKASTILLGNVLLIAATLSILLGTLYPIISQLIWQKSLSVGPPYFNTVLLPMLFMILILMSVAVHLKWQQAPDFLKVRKYSVSLLLACVTVLMLINLTSLSFVAALAFTLALYLIISTLMFIHKPQKIGMIVAHIGIAIFVMGIVFVSSWQIEKEFAMQLGQTVEVEGFNFTFNQLQEIKGSNFEGTRGTFTIYKDNQLITQLFPEKRFFIAREQAMTETAIHSHLMRDFYVALGEPLDNGAWSVRFYIKPFIRFIWLGGMMVALAAFFAAIRSRCIKEKRVASYEIDRFA